MKKISSEVIQSLPAGLSAIAGNRDLITTKEYAQIWNVADQTVRKNFCETGHAYGLKPIKIGNRLLWSVAQIAEKLQGAI
jgi:Fic family protein